jgi:hypothetical protein
MPFFDHLIDTCFAHHQIQHSFFAPTPGAEVFHADKAAGEDILCSAAIGSTPGLPNDQVVTWEGQVNNPHDTIEGLKIGWTYPPEDIKISVNRTGDQWEDVTNWLPATTPDYADNNIVVQNVILRHPQAAKRIRLHMRDKRKSGTFGIKQIALVGHTLLS